AILLMFCWFGFNLGSVPSYGSMTADLPRVAINTLAAMAGGIAGSLLGTSLGGKPDPIVTPNGGLAGAVAICSGVHLVHPVFAIAIGIVAGAQIPLTARFIERRLKIDDPCGVGPVHATPGILGGLAAGLWAPMIRGGFHGYTLHFTAQLLGTAAAVVYGLLASVALFAVVDRLTGLRVSEQEELSGLDLSEHGIPAYPELALTRAATGTPLHVLDEDEELCGVISMSDVTKIERSERAHVRVAAVYTREVQSVFPDQTIHEVVERMRERHLANFPVVSRREERKLLGMITKSDIVLAYRRVAIEAAV